VGSTTLPTISSLQDLTSLLQSNFSLLQGIPVAATDTIASVPTQYSKSTIGYSGNGAWNLGDFKFTLSGSTTGSLQIFQPGDTLMKYTSAFATEVGITLATTTNANTTTSITAPKTPEYPADKAYVCISLDMTLTGAVNASYQQGVFGITGNGSTTETLTVAFYKECLPTDTVGAAVAAAFADLKLPLHPNTLTDLKPGDYLYHTFDANLQAGFGVSIGYDKVLYAGSGTADLPGPGAGVGVTASVKPEFQAGLNIPFKFEYAGSFEALLWTDAATNLAHYHLYRSTSQDTSLGFNLGVNLTSDPAASATATTTQLENFFKGLIPAALGNAFDAVWQKVTSGVTNDITKYVNEANSKVAAWLKPFQSLQATLDIAVSKSQQKCLLLEYTFDTTRPEFPAAWQYVLKDDFYNAFITSNGAVQLATGSGLEKLYDDKTAVTLNLFGKLTGTWTTDIIQNSSLVYAGNGIFHFIAADGIQMLSTLGDSSKEIDMYFATELDLPPAGAPNLLVPSGSTALHCILKASNNPTFGAYIGAFLNDITTGENTTNLVSGIKTLAAQPNTTQLLHLIFADSVYANLTYSNVTAGPYDETADQRNYAAFQKACLALSVQLPFGISYGALPYSIWRDWSIACNDNWPAPAGASPSRKDIGVIGGAQPQACLYYYFGASCPWNSLGVALAGESAFMNLCEDLAKLAARSATAGPWSDLVGQLKAYIIKNDLSPYYLAPTALALTYLLGTSAPNPVTGPAPGLTTENSIGITLAYSY
jgi:hypothetical protein